MSASLWDQLPASAGALLTDEQCLQLLDTDINLFNNSDDLFKQLPTAAPKTEYDTYNLQDDASNSLYPPSPMEVKPNRAELANNLLQQLETNCKQENIFPNWLEEKAELPIFENISQVPERVELSPTLPIAIAPTFAAPQPTEELLREFESVYGAVELTHLTPPQSPPGPATQLLLSYAQQAQSTAFAPALTSLVAPQESWPSVTAALHVAETVPDYDCGMEEVDELVRRRAAQLATPQHSGGSTSVSPQSSPPSSPRSSCTDEEWMVPVRSKPYSRNVDDRRSRKKEQNKNAATRYRQKKKAEVEVLLNEEQSMRQRNSELNDKCSDLQREIRYLKGLMRDLFKAKGLIK